VPNGGDQIGFNKTSHYPIAYLRANFSGEKMGGLCYSSAARFRLLIKRLRADQQPEDNIATRNHRLPASQS
jgi:hypothetical protein